ncbi:MAG: MoaD/ThiS family protein, partial [Planctomycetota bacterium]
MEIEVCYFAALREQIGTERETVAVDDGVSADALLARLGELHPGSAGLIQRSRVAQSHAFVPGGAALEAGA